MLETETLALGRTFFEQAVLLALPAMVTSLVVGLIISVFQAATSIQEQTLAFVPRMLALALVFVITMPWMLRVSIYFTVQMITHASEMGG